MEAGLNVRRHKKRKRCSDEADFLWTILRRCKSSVDAVEPLQKLGQTLSMWRTKTCKVSRDERFARIWAVDHQLDALDKRPEKAEPNILGQGQQNMIEIAGRACPDGSFHLDPNAEFRNPRTRASVPPMLSRKRSAAILPLRSGPDRRCWIRLAGAGRCRAGRLQTKLNQKQLRQLERKPSRSPQALPATAPRI